MNGPPPVSNVPWAHIRRKDPWSDVAWCGYQCSVIGTFMFDDPVHAIEIYGSDNRFLQACQACIDEYRGKV
jgi:hypothetical protein